MLCALQIVIAPECRAQGLSARMIQRMAEIGRDRDEGLYVEPNVWMVHPPATLRA